jgi:uncharacterized membrane protein YfcA
MAPLSLIFGAVVGLSLGLTGGGGAIFAVPLLVYGLHLAPREAVGVSLAAVGATTGVGCLHRWMLNQVELRTGLLFAAAGMLGAPVGTWIAGRLPETLLLLLFAGLMIVVALRLWRQSSRPPLEANADPELDDRDGPTCRRDAAGALRLTSRCAGLLVFVGALTGILSGLFGVGGGFVIVPALVLFSGMSMQRAIGTSLLVITLVSGSGVASHLWAGRDIPLGLTALFVAGGIAGMLAGQQIALRLPGPVLQRVFVVVLLGVATFVLFRNLTG